MGAMEVKGPVELMRAMGSMEVTDESGGTGVTLTISSLGTTAASHDSLHSSRLGLVQ